MTNYIILSLCLIVLLAYLFDITSKYTKIPSVILLIGLGVVIRIIVENTGFSIPDLEPILPVIGTLGLILIVLEASLDIKLEKKKVRLIIRSVVSSIVLFVIFSGALAAFMVSAMGYSLVESLLNSIPLGIISSAVAISSTTSLRPEEKEFVVYESSFSDIIGILVFDFILLNQGSIAEGLVHFVFSGLVTALLAVLVTSLLAMLLHKISYHVNYVIILTSVILVYVLAKLSHLPALFLILVFGLALSNYKLIENTVIKKVVDFEKFRTDLDSFKKIMRELTFLVRSFFFILFGYYTRIDTLLSPGNIFLGLMITSGIFLLRWGYFALILRVPAVPLVLFAPRGLITILLFISIPAGLRVPFISEEIITLVILLSIVALMIGNVLLKKETVISVPVSADIEKKGDPEPYDKEQEGAEKNNVK